MRTRRDIEMLSGNQLILGSTMSSFSEKIEALRLELLLDIRDLLLESKPFDAHKVIDEYNKSLTEEDK